MKHCLQKDVVKIRRLHPLGAQAVEQLKEEYCTPLSVKNKRATESEGKKEKKEKERLRKKERWDQEEKEEEGQDWNRERKMERKVELA